MIAILFNNLFHSNINTSNLIHISKNRKISIFLSFPFVLIHENKQEAQFHEKYEFELIRL